MRKPAWQPVTLPCRFPHHYPLPSSAAAELLFCSGARTTRPRGLRQPQLRYSSLTTEADSINYAHKNTALCIPPAANRPTERISTTPQASWGSLTPQPKRLHNSPISLRAFAAQVIKQPPPLAHQFQQATARVMILFMHLEVLGQVLDARRQERNLHLWRTGIILVLFEAVDNFLFLLAGKTHSDIVPSVPKRSLGPPQVPMPCHVRTITGPHTDCDRTAPGRKSPRSCAALGRQIQPPQAAGAAGLTQLPACGSAVPLSYH